MTFGTRRRVWPLSAGANVKAVQRMLGHAKASMTLDVYADLFDADLDDVAVNLDAQFEPPPTRPARTRPSEFAGDGGRGGCVATAGRLGAVRCGLTAGWVDCDGLSAN
ncbi:MAG: hypothetical protein QOF31_3626 [Mycobacterium sp.]|jgi:hypothetical protein|nr:hypothetical protein [Mycobacterium sp.]